MTNGVRHAEEESDDFQDIRLWPELTVTVAERLYRTYGRSLVVPMTIVHPDYLERLRQGFAGFMPQLHHFCLTASLETIRRRLDARGDTGDCWAWRKSVAYLPRLDHERYRIHISTEERSAGSVAQEIIHHLA